MPTVNLLKRRDKLEAGVRVAFAQQKDVEKNFHIYSTMAKDALDNYIGWLKRHDMEPTIDINHYKQLHS